MILVTLVCCYAACWGPTKMWGVDDTVHYTVWDRNVESLDEWSFILQIHDAKATMPLVVGVTPIASQPRRRYYFWFFGYVVKLPYEREVPWDDRLTLGW